MRRLAARLLRLPGLARLVRPHQRAQLERWYYALLGRLPRWRRTCEANPGPPARRIEPGADRVLATFVLTSFEHRRYLAESLESALAQTYRPLEIVVSDDGSTDGSIDFLRERLARFEGPHRTRLNVNHERLAGLHLNAVMPLVRGAVIVLGSSDDVAHPERVARTVSEMGARGVSLVTANATRIDAQGRPDGLFHPDAKPVDLDIESLVGNLHITPCFGAGLAYTRDVWDAFGPLLPGPRQVDVVLPFRAALLGGTYFIREPLLDYRIHGANASYRLQRRAGSAAEATAARFWEAGNRVANYSVLVETLDHHMASHPDEPALEPLRERLVARLLAELHGWSALRRAGAVEGVLPV